MNEAPQHIVIFDDTCNLCSSWITSLQEKSPKSTQFLGQHSKEAQSLINEYQLDTTISTSIIYLSKGKVYTKSDACLYLAKNTHGWIRRLYIIKIVPRPIRDFVYKIFAKYRYRFNGKRKTCKLHLQ